MIAACPRPILCSGVMDSPLPVNPAAQGMPVAGTVAITCRDARARRIAGYSSVSQSRPIDATSGRQKAQWCRRTAPPSSPERPAITGPMAQSEKSMSHPSGCRCPACHESQYDESAPSSSHCSTAIDSELPKPIKGLVGRCEINELSFDNEDMSTALAFGQRLWSRLDKMADHYERKAGESRGEERAHWNQAAEDMRHVLNDTKADTLRA